MGAAMNLTPLYGRSPTGERVYGAKPTGPGKRISTVGALGLGGLTSAMCFEGTLTGEVFLQFLDEFLVPGLKPGQIVILDNAKAHKVEGVRERIEGAGARVLYLPPYSPDLNPIEMACSKVKQFLRKAQARTVEALYEAIAQALQTLSPSDAKGFFKHVGFCILSVWEPLYITSFMLYEWVGRTERGKVDGRVGLGLYSPSPKPIFISSIFNSINLPFAQI